MAHTIEHPFMIGIVGETVTGKTTLARHLDATRLEDLDHQLVGSFKQIQGVRRRSMLQAAGYQGSITDGPAMREFHRDLRADGRSEEMFKRYHEQMGRSIVVIDAISHPMDAETVLKYGGVLAALVIDPADRQMVLLDRFLNEQGIQDAPLDEKHLSQTWEEAELEVQGDPNDPFASDILATLELVSPENRINSNQPKTDMLHDGRQLVTTLALRHLGLEPAELLNA